MDAHTQIGGITEHRNRIFEGLAIGHERSAGHNAAAMGIQDALIDLVSEPEIVRIDNQLLHNL
jgi:hypothetical protein